MCASRLIVSVRLETVGSKAEAVHGSALGRLVDALSKLEDLARVLSELQELWRGANRGSP